MRAMWHALRGLAYAGQGRVKEAQTEQAALKGYKDDASLKTLYVSSVNVASAIAAIADETLAGEIAAKQKSGQYIVPMSRRYEAAAKLEDALIYMEPPDWPIPVRQLWGAALLEAGRHKDAELAFRDDMKKFPDNGWSLSGLQVSLERQGKKAEAETVRARLAEQWRAADTELTGARVKLPAR